MIKTHKEYKQWAIKEHHNRDKEITFDKVDDRYYYVYRITNTRLNKHYYGSRNSVIMPQLDIGVKYFSTSKDKDFIKDQKENPSDYKYKVVKVFNNTKDKEIYESYLHQYFNVRDNINFYNGSNQTPFGFDTTGMVSVKDKDDNTMSVSVYDERYLSGELTGLTKGVKHTIKTKHKMSISRIGRIPVKDKDGNTFIVDVCNPRYLSGELVHVTKGRVTVRDKYGNTSSVSINDPRYLSGELVVDSKGRVLSDDIKKKMSDSKKGKVNIKDKYGNTSSVSINDPRYLSGELVPISKGKTPTKETRMKISNSQKGSKSSSAKKINIYNDKDELMFECNGDFVSTCKENGLPSVYLYKCYHENIKIDYNKNKRGLSRAINNGNIKFQGWYARYVE